ncbi:hypothetical protein B0H14DRAFT_2617858 [Mycena olivaceomarginata]|nr:hypothetical protein B0H14DRAFT_2617858 [Mycena olivaceomarginata]
MSGGYIAPKAPGLDFGQCCGPGPSPSRAGPGPSPGLGLGPQEIEAQALPGRAQAPAFRPSRALQNTRSGMGCSTAEYTGLRRNRAVAFASQNRGNGARACGREIEEDGPQRRKNKDKDKDKDTEYGYGYGTDRRCQRSGFEAEDRVGWDRAVVEWIGYSGVNVLHYVRCVRKESVEAHSTRIPRIRLEFPKEPKRGQGKI